jgi:catechol 2,3-dioxygenase-like lactoylglutathione lyase family enzyme
MSLRSALHPKNESKNGDELQCVGGITQVVDVMVPVEDPDEAIAFYTGVLGFELVADRPYGDGQRWVAVAPPEGGPAIALVPSHPAYPAGSHTGIVLGADDVGTVHAEMKEMDVDVDAEIMGGGEVPSFFWFRDRDANTLMIVRGT